MKCEKITFSEGQDLGEAAHIYPSSKGGARSDELVSAHFKDKLNSPENGIWLCKNCHAIVDGKVSAAAYPVIKMFELKANEGKLQKSEIVVNNEGNVLGHEIGQDFTKGGRPVHVTNNKDVYGGKIGQQF